MFSSLDKYRDHGILILRVGMGAMFMMHGFPKLTGGQEGWAKVGAAMGNIGINFMPEFWGLMAACSEFFGGLLLIIGLFVRPASALMLFTMCIAALMHIKGGQGFQGSAHAIENGIVFLALIFIGPGIYSLDQKFTKKSE